MTSPFVVSLKVTGDGRSAVSAVTSTANAIEKLNAKTDAAKAKAEALNVSLGRRSAAEANRTGLQSTLEAIQAEQRLESARLQAQISDKGRADSINRLAQLGRDAAAVNKGIAASEHQVAAAHDEAARSARAAALASGELAQARSVALNARQASINAALGISNQPSGDRGADIAAYGRELDRLRAIYVPAFAASQAYNRELDSINHAHRVGAISAVEQATAIAALDARYRSAATSAGALRSSTGRGAGGAQAAHTTNLLFQAQDIAMMTAMGQAPMMLAMQQGMQVGGIFHQIGNGRQIVQALGGAIVGLLNPLNLATVATIALGAAGVQWFMSTFEEAEDATDALERHREMLDSLLEGYDGAKKAADEALESALKLPQGVVASDLRATLREQAEAQEDLQRRIEASRETLGGLIKDLRDNQNVASFGMGPGPDSEGIQQIAMLRELSINASSSRQELHAAMVAARELFNTAEDDSIKELADQVYQLALELLQVSAQADSAGAALRALPRDIQIRLRISEEYTSALSGMQDLFIDPRSRFDIAREELQNQFDHATATAQSYGQLVGAASEYERVLASIDTAEAEANAKANARGAKAAQKPFDQWAGSVQQFEQKTASQQLEISLLGKSTYEIERQKAAFDLLNQAKQAGVQITEPMIGQINRMADQYAATTVHLEEARKAQAALDQQMNFYKGTFNSFFADIKSGLRDGQNFWEAFGNAGASALDKVADRALGMAADGLFDMIFGAVSGAFTGGATGGAWGKGLWGSAIFNAKGNVYSSPSLSAYSNQIVDKPTMFAFAKGAGIMGEAGAEAIIPLTRTRSGDLGVRMVNGGSGGGGGQNTFKFETIINMPPGSNRAEFEAMLDERDRVLNDQFASRVAYALENPRRG